MKSLFEADWRLHFGSQPPIKNQLALEGVSHWVRFHALPGSQAYPENAAQRAIYADRANRLIEACFPSQSRCWLIIGHCEMLFDVRGRRATRQLIESYDMKRVGRWNGSETDAFEGQFWFHAAPLDLQPGSLDRLFRLIWEEQIPSALLFDAGSGRLICPYHGGFDLRLDSQTFRDSMRARFAAWLPECGEGLER